MLGILDSIFSRHITEKLDTFCGVPSIHFVGFSNRHGSAIIFHFVYFSDLDSGQMSASSGMGIYRGIYSSDEPHIWITLSFSFKVRPTYPHQALIFF